MQRTSATNEQTKNLFIMELKSNIQSMQWDLLTIKRKINKQIRTLPDNQNIKRIHKVPHCFIIQFSEIQKDKNINLSPQYYDFHYQYRAIVNKLKEVSPLEIYNCLSKMIEVKSFKVYRGVNLHGQSCHETISIHPEVISYLKNLIQ
jgi:hypothetical protein